jgi:hypothetical protein
VKQQIQPKACRVTHEPTRLKVSLRGGCENRIHPVERTSRRSHRLAGGGAFTLGTFFFLIIAGSINAASFDCGKAVSEVEKIICGDDKLSRLDETLNKAYLQALERDDRLGFGHA